MKTGFDILDGTLVAADPAAACIRVYSEIDATERQELIDTLDLDQPTLESILDPDEVPRIEITPQHVLIIWKRPDNVSFEQLLKFEVSSFGIVLEATRATVISAGHAVTIGPRTFPKMHSLNELVLRLLFRTTQDYLGHLKAIKMIAHDLQNKVSRSMGNTFLLQMFNLGESLVYYYNALEANSTVLTKLHSMASDRLHFSRDDLDLLEDLIIENQQACKQANIYTTVLSGLMDARGSIVNNNMNMLLKNLTIINVVFMPLNLLASVGGMSEFSMMTSGVDWRITYAAFMVAMGLLGWATWVMLPRFLDRGFEEAGTRRGSKVRRKR
jgi:magnesium transporter